MELVRVPRLTSAVPYAYASVSPDGYVFTAGACPLDADGAIVGPGDVALQTRRTLDNLLVALRAADCGPEDVVKTTVYVASSDQADLVTAWAVVEAEFGRNGPPSTLLGVSVLGFTGQFVVIVAVAARARG